MSARNKINLFRFDQEGNGLKNGLTIRRSEFGGIFILHHLSLIVFMMFKVVSFRKFR